MGDLENLELSEDKQTGDEVNGEVKEVFVKLVNENQSVVEADCGSGQVAMQIPENKLVAVEADKCSEQLKVATQVPVSELTVSEADSGLEQVAIQVPENEPVVVEADKCSELVARIPENEPTVEEVDSCLEQVAAQVPEKELTVVEADNGSEQVMGQIPEKELTVVDAESLGLQSLLEKPHADDDKRDQLPAEVESNDEPGSVEDTVEINGKPSVGPKVVKDVDAAETHSVLQQHNHENAEVTEPMEIDSHESNAVGVKSAEVADVLSPNGHVQVEMGEKEPTTEMPLKEEKMEGEHSTPIHPFSFDHFLNGHGPGTEEEQDAFMKELENFYKSKNMDFKPPKFYGEGLNCLKLWRGVTKLGGYDQVTICKLWKQVGETFKPPKTCTTISWTFRNFYEKALLEYEKHKIQTGEFQVSPSNASEPAGVDNQVEAVQGSGSGRARRDAAARAMQGWHSQRLLGNGEVGDPIIKEKSPMKKRKGSSLVECGMKVARTNDVKPQVDILVDDLGEPADWVKINVRKMKDCFEIYALVPGLLREEVQVQSDPAGRLIISGDPEQPDSPWGVTAFKKVIILPSRIDPHQTSAVVTLHGQLFIRAPFDQSDM